MDRIFSPYTGTVTIPWLPRAANDNLAITWYETSSKTALTSTTALTWSVAAGLQVQEDVEIDEKAITVSDASSLQVMDNICINGIFNSIQHIDGNEIILYSPVLEKLTTSDYIYPCQCVLTVHGSCTAYNRYYIEASNIKIAVWTFSADSIEPPLSFSQLYNEYPSILSRVVTFRNIKNLIYTTWHNHTMPKFFDLLEQNQALPHYISEVGTLLMYDVLDRILIDLNIADRESDYSYILQEVRAKKDEQWNSIIERIEIETGEDSLEEPPDFYNNVVSWERS